MDRECAIENVPAVTVTKLSEGSVPLHNLVIPCCRNPKLQ